MRDYSKIAPQFWIGKTGKTLRRAGVDAQLVGLYLMSSPHANMLGLYYLAKETIGYETGLGYDRSIEALDACIEAGFCSYDEESEMVWVHEMATYQISDALAGGDKRIKGIQNEYNSLPDNIFLGKFYDKYSVAFCMISRRSVCESEINPIKGASKGLASQEQEQEHKQEHEQEQNNVATAPAIAPEKNEPDEVQVIFDYWRRVLKHPGAKLDAKREKVIKNALKLYSPADLCIAIRGCSKSPYHMGKNTSGTVYDSLGLILRDADHIDSFIALDAGNAKSSSNETIDEKNARLIQEFLNDEHSQDDDGMTVEMEI